MAFFAKLKERLFRSSSKLDEGLDAIIEDGGNVNGDPGAAAQEPLPTASADTAAQSRAVTDGLGGKGADGNGTVDRAPGPSAFGPVVRRTLDDEMLEQIEELLIASDMGVETAMRVAANMAEGRIGRKFSSGELKELLADEIARFPASAGREGPPIPLALERTADWRETRSVLLTSTPVLPGDAMDQWYSSGDQRHWFVSCSCGHAWSPEWKHVAADPPAIVCPECGRRYPDGPEHVNLVEGGHWRPTSDAEDPEVISYSLPRWLSAASTLRACVTDRKRAERKNTLAVWRRTCAAVPSDPDPSEVVDVSPIEARREPMDHWPPADVSIAFGGTDVQADRLEVAILGFPRDRSWSAVLAYHVIRGRPAYAEPWAKLQKVLDGAGVRLCAIDAGFEPRPVRLLAQRDRRVVPIRGMAGDGRMPIEAPAPGGKSWCHVVGADPLKRDLLQKVDSGWLRLPRAPWCTSSWLRSLTAEHEERVERAGRVVTRWVVHHRRNEAMDACLYALAVSNLVPAERTGRRRRFVRLAS